MPRYFSESSCFLRIPFFPFNYGAYLIDAVAVVFFFRKEIPVEAELLTGLILRGVYMSLKRACAPKLSDSLHTGHKSELKTDPFLSSCKRSLNGADNQHGCQFNRADISESNKKCFFVLSVIIRSQLLFFHKCVGLMNFCVCM